MLIKTVLSQLENFKGFVYGKVSLRKRWFKKPTLVPEHCDGVRDVGGKGRSCGYPNRNRPEEI